MSVSHFFFLISNNHAIVMIMKLTDRGNESVKTMRFVTDNIFHVPCLIFKFYEGDVYVCSSVSRVWGVRNI